jgi:modified peptide precursor CbpA
MEKNQQNCPSPASLETEEMTTLEVIAHRRSCDVTGTGLTHFILPTEKSE